MFIHVMNFVTFMVIVGVIGLALWTTWHVIRNALADRTDRADVIAQHNLRYDLGYETRPMALTPVEQARKNLGYRGESHDC